MPGAIIQLVAHGLQDMYLTSDPQITYFKIIYRRHTNFSIESVPQQFSSPANFGEMVTCTLTKLGDLINRAFIYIDLPAIPKFIDAHGNIDRIKKFAWVENLGYALIQNVSFEIDGKLIDKQYGEWLYIWSQVAQIKQNALSKMIGNVKLLYNFTNGKPGYELYIPLNFWFNNNTGLSLPLVALSSSDVKINITFRKLDECIRVGATHSIDVADDVISFKPGDYIQQTIANESIYGYFMDFDYIKKKIYYIKIQSPTANLKTFESDSINSQNSFKTNDYRIYNSIDKTFVTPKPGSREMVENTNLQYKPKFVNSFLYIDYVYLDNAERIKFASSCHEYLIEQIQYNVEIAVKNSNIKQRLNLLHPCKSHYWVAQLDSITGAGTINDIFNFTDSHIRYRDGTLYGKNLIQSASILFAGLERTSVRTGDYYNLVQPYAHHSNAPITGVNMYSFALNPEQYQPSSTMNMSEISDISMLIHLCKCVNSQNTCKIRAYTLNYNIIRIYSNIAQLAFV